MVTIYDNKTVICLLHPSTFYLRTNRNYIITCCKKFVMKSLISLTAKILLFYIFNHLKV